MLIPIRKKTTLVLITRKKMLVICKRCSMLLKIMVGRLPLPHPLRRTMVGISGCNKEN
jgi:NifB/MoaA-like Fe-S oxidoreductase